MQACATTCQFSYTASDFREAARTARDPFIWQALRDLAEDYEALAAEKAAGSVQLMERFEAA